MDREIELRLVEQLRDGNPAAFDAVYDELNGRLFTFLLRLSRRRDVAEDLLDETWLRVVRHAGRLRSDTRLVPWIFTVARNLHVSYVRSRMLEDSATSSLMALWPFPGSASSPFESAAASELERRIEHALASMPASSREVLLLVAVGGLDHADAANVLGVSSEALRQRLSRARALLARMLAEEVPCTTHVLREVVP
jgi:RNA polymerase sigma-70 factor (ECF subfamily)